MKNQNQKKSLLERLTGIKKEKKSSCCGNFRIEEIPLDTANNKGPNDQSSEKDSAKK